uniref:Discs, largehomolog 2 n=1 Tax=Steinernema glaseri TaxID=37863 RepID=A0A1I7Y512_9BILA
GAQGRESGYGTGPSRLWHHSPRLKHKLYKSRSPETSQVPLTVYATKNASVHSMTYV